MTVTAFAKKHFPEKRVITLGIPDYFVKHGTLNELYKECGFDAESIKNRVKSFL